MAEESGPDCAFDEEEGFESDRSVDNCVVGPVNEESGVAVSSCRRRTPEQRGWHFAECGSDTEIDAVEEPFAGGKRLSMRCAEPATC